MATCVCDMGASGLGYLGDPTHRDDYRSPLLGLRSPWGGGSLGRETPWFPASAHQRSLKRAIDTLSGASIGPGDRLLCRDRQ